MKHIRSLFAFLALALVCDAQISRVPMSPPAKQILVNTNSFGVLGPISGNTNTLQEVLDWIDDYWPRFTNGTYVTMPTTVTNFQTLVNWLDTNFLTRVDTNILHITDTNTYYPSSNPSNYLNAAGVIAVGNTNWVPLTNQIGIGTITNEMGYAPRRFIGFRGYSYDYRVTIPAGTKTMLNDSALAGGTHDLIASKGVGSYTNTDVINKSLYSNSGRLQFQQPGWYQMSFNFGFIAPGTLSADTAIHVSMRNVTATNTLLLFSNWANEANAYCVGADMFYVASSSLTNIYGFTVDNTYGIPNITNILTSIQGQYLGE